MSARRGMVAALLLAVVVAGAVGLAGCAGGKADPAASVAANKEQCFANMRQIKMAMDLIYADAGIYPSVTDSAKKLDVKCPSGGTYSFDSAKDVVSCSVHGHP